jgi:hypothetical protein
MWWVVNDTPRLLYPGEKESIPIVQETGWAPGPVWTGAENLAPTGIRSPDRPDRSELLYRLRYPGPQLLASGERNNSKYRVNLEKKEFFF